MIRRQLLQKAILYGLLSVYCFALVKPVLPLVEDLIAHTFFNSDHMITVHYENGHYHLHAELKNGSDQQKERSGENVPVSVYETLANHLNSESEPMTAHQVSTSLCFPTPMQHPSDVCILKTSPPPRS